MALTRPNQQLRRDLKETAALLKWSGVDLFGVAKQMLAAGDEQGADDLTKIAFSFQEVEDKLEGYADEVRAGRILPTHLLCKYCSGRDRFVDQPSEL